MNLFCVIRIDYSGQTLRDCHETANLPPFYWNVALKVRCYSLAWEKFVFFCHVIFGILVDEKLCIDEEPPEHEYFTRAGNFSIKHSFFLKIKYLNFLSLIVNSRHERLRVFRMTWESQLITNERTLCIKFSCTSNNRIRTYFYRFWRYTTSLLLVYNSRWARTAYNSGRFSFTLHKNLLIGCVYVL